MHPKIVRKQVRSRIDEESIHPDSILETGEYRKAAANRPTKTPTIEKSSFTVPLKIPRIRQTNQKIRIAASAMFMIVSYGG